MKLWLQSSATWAIASRDMERTSSLITARSRPPNRLRRGDQRLEALVAAERIEQRVLRNEDEPGSCSANPASSRPIA